MVTTSKRMHREVQIKHELMTCKCKYTLMPKTNEHPKLRTRSPDLNTPLIQSVIILFYTLIMKFLLAFTFLFAIQIHLIDYQNCPPRL